MSDQVKYQLERAEDALRSALMMLDSKESVYVISAISKALIEIDNSLFAERAAEGSISITKEEQPDGNVKYEMNNTPFKWDNQTSFVSANK
jgi:hypothetical protein